MKYVNSIRNRFNQTSINLLKTYDNSENKKRKLPYFERRKTFANPVTCTSQVAKLNDAERELSDISERLKGSSKGKVMTQTNLLSIDHM